MSARPTRSAAARRPALLIIGPLPPPAGGVGMQVEEIRRSPLAARWRLECFDLSKPQQEGKPSVVTVWDVVWTLWHAVALPWRLLRLRPAVALVESTADTGYFRDLLLVLECRALGVPVVLHWHGYPDAWQFPGTPWWRRWLFALGVKLSACFVIIADSYRDFFLRYVPAERLAVVPNFIDGSRFAGPRSESANGVTALFVGRVGPAKGTDLLLEAVRRVRAAHPQLKAVLVGDGETPQALAEAAGHPLVAAGAVRVTGPVVGAPLEEYRRADLFVLPTRADSLPLSLLEAMAAGLPSIACDLGAIRWVLEDGACGVVLEPEDLDGLTRELERLAGDPELRARMGERARQRQVERFDARGVTEVLDGILRAAARR